jgi:hypothetical protein
MDFAPYQDASPERVRALSPPPAGSNDGTKSPRRSFSPNLRLPAGTASTEDPWGRPNLNAAISSGNVRAGRDGYGDIEANVAGENADTVQLFETSVGLRLDYEAALAYLLLPPAGAVFCLLVETRSDYVRSVGPLPTEAEYIRKEG